MPRIVFGSHLTVSDLVRDAIRDKIHDDAPHIYLSMFEHPISSTTVMRE